MVKVLSSAIVTPEAETPSHSVWLPTLDLYQVRTHLPTIYFYRPTGDASFFSAELLKRAMAKALVPFYPLAGRLGPDPAGRLELKCNGAGVLFVVAESDLAIDEFGDFTPSPEKRKLLIPTVDSADGYNNLPLVIFQVTFFKCGGVCLGSGVHHTVCDGVASLHFINTWSDVARGLGLAVPPFLDRSLVRARSPPAIRFPHPEFNPNPPAVPGAAKKPVSVAILDLSADQLAAIKSRVNASKTRYSTYETISAHVWHCACGARRLPAGHPTRAFITVDSRSRLRPPLPPGYIGNVIFPAVVAASSDEVLADPLEETAARFRHVIGGVDDEYIRDALDFLEVQENVEKIGRWVGEFPASDLSIVSWTRLPVYEADFGWGRPVYMGPAMLLYAGLCYIMPPTPASKDGGVRVAMSLEEEYMEEFKELFFGL